MRFASGTAHDFVCGIFLTPTNHAFLAIKHLPVLKGFLLTGIQRIHSFFRHDFELRSCKIDFIEISVKDEKILAITRFLSEKKNRLVIESLSEAGVTFTLHGEGEIDDKRRIYLAHPDDSRRKQYINQTIDHLNTVINLLDENVVNVVVHPDLLLKKVGRTQQITMLAESLGIISDYLPPKIPISIESRGSKKPRCLRPTITDLQFLEEKLSELGIQKVFHCIDVAQAMIYNEFNYFTVVDLIKSFYDKTKEYHLSDVMISSRGHPILGQPLGKGIITWQRIVPHLNVDALHLFETIGGIKAFEYSCETLRQTQ